MQRSPSPASCPPQIQGSITHAFRPTIFSRERCYWLEPGALVSSDGAVEERLPLAEVSRIRIFSVPSGIGAPLRRSILYLRSGRHTLLQSSHYVRFGVVEDRGETYRELMEALLPAVAAANPQVQVIVGPSLGLWLVWLVILIASFVVLGAGVVLTLTGELPLAAVLYLGILLGFVPLAWPVIAGGRPRRVAVDGIPANLFGSG